MQTEARKTFFYISCTLAKFSKPIPHRVVTPTAQLSGGILRFMTSQCSDLFQTLRGDQVLICLGGFSLLRQNKRSDKSYHRPQDLSSDQQSSISSKRRKRKQGRGLRRMSQQCDTVSKGFSAV